MGRLSVEFKRLAEEAKGKSMNLKEVMNAAGPRCEAIITAICSFPFLFFIPLPGLSTLFGLIILSAGCAIALNRTLWLPRFMLHKKMSGKIISKIFSKGATILSKIEKVARPRSKFVHSHPIFQRINGILLVLCGIILMLPLPPGTNFPPGLSSFLISIGILEEDGVFIILGYLGLVITLFLYIGLPLMGYYDLKAKPTH
jgi:hypothetical protein